MSESKELDWSAELEYPEMNQNFRFLLSFQRLLGVVNDILLIPMFASIIMEITHSGFQFSSASNIFFCALFFTEWLLGLILAKSTREYAFNFTRILDLLSTIPIGQYFQGFRLFRLTRLIKLVRVVLRAKRYNGPGKSLVRVLSVVGATTFAGAYTIMIVEGSSGSENVSILSFGDALWWSLVTISTVGYGDLYPVTTGGRIVAVFLIVAGVGVCGYIAGFMANLMSEGDDSEEIDRLIRVEKKLDIMANYFEIEGWKYEELPEKEEFVYRKSS